MFVYLLCIRRVYALWGTGTLSVWFKVVVWELRSICGTRRACCPSLSTAFTQEEAGVQPNCGSGSRWASELCDTVACSGCIGMVVSGFEGEVLTSCPALLRSLTLPPPHLGSWVDFCQQSSSLWVQKPMRFPPGNDLGSKVKMVLCALEIPLCQPPTPPSEIWP